MRNLAKPLIKSAIVGGFLVALLGPSAAEAGAAPTPNWDAIAQCESGGNWQANTGNGAYGGLQFKPATWAQYGGVGNPANATREQQIAVANRLFADQGVEPWPKCGTQSGLPIGLYSHPAQGIRQIINSLIQAAVP